MTVLISIRQPEDARGPLARANRKSPQGRRQGILYAEQVTNSLVCHGFVLIAYT
jgi:hypothetical protein